MLRYSVTTVLVLLAGGVSAQEPNPRFILSIDGPCGETIVGPPGGVYDDDTGGLPYFNDITGPPWELDPRRRTGHTWDITLNTRQNGTRGGASAWEFGVGVEGPLRITDITTDGTASCVQGLPFPECRRWGGGVDFCQLTGLPNGAGPQTEENRGAACTVVLKFDWLASLPPEGTEVICKIRVSGDFPSQEGETAKGRILFAPREGTASFEAKVGWDYYITPDEGNPPLELHDCVVTLKASSVAPFIRCDANADGKLNVSDAVWMLTELFLGGPKTACEPAADCDGNGERELSDAVYALMHLFQSGPEPSAPYPRCDRIDVPVEQCPPGSTGCE